MTFPRSGVAGAILAGGRSTRMGRDKALLPWHDRTLAAHLAHVLGRAGCDPVVQIGGSSETGLEVVADRYPGDGPLGGLLTALSSLVAPEVVVIACDLPRLTPATVERVCEGLADHARAQVAVADSGRLEPLCAVWRRAPALTMLESRWHQGERSLRGALAHLDVVRVTVPPDDLLNANAPEDLARAGNVADMVEEIAVEQLSDALAAGATLIDVREPDEYSQGHAPGAVLMPLGSVLAGEATVSGSGTVYVICRSGARSMRACEFMAHQGVQAVNVAGGTMAWVASGFDVVEGMEPG